MTDQITHWEQTDRLLVAELDGYALATIEETRNGVVLVVEHASGRSTLAVFDTIEHAQLAAEHLANA